MLYSLILWSWKFWLFHDQDSWNVFFTWTGVLCADMSSKSSWVDILAGRWCLPKNALIFCANIVVYVFDAKNSRFWILLEKLIKVFLWIFRYFTHIRRKYLSLLLSFSLPFKVFVSKFILNVRDITILIRRMKRFLPLVRDFFVFLLWNQIIFKQVNTSSFITTIKMALLLHH